MSEESDLLARDESAISEAMKIRFFPFVLASQSGATVTGVDGDELIDFTSSWAVANTGYRHPDVLEAIQEEMDRSIANSPISFSHTPVTELAERLRTLTDFPFETKVWFGHSGSEAGDLIAKAVFEIGSGDHLINFQGSYHGITDGAAKISGHSAQEGVESESVLTFPFPNKYRPETGRQDLADEALKPVKEAFSNHEIAGVITEPLQSDGGILVPPDGFLSGLEELCRKNDAYFIVDEVKAGLGRTGRTFAYEHEDVTPDAIMIGKPLGSGLPISAVVGKKNLVDFEPASHMMTTAGGPLPTAAAHATLDVLESENLANRASELGDFFQETLVSEIGDRSVVGDIRGRGLMQGVEIVEPSSNVPDSELTARIALWGRRHGIAVFYVGLASNVLELTPPLTISKEQLTRGVQRLRESIDAAQTEPLDDALLEKYMGW